MTSEQSPHNTSSEEQRRLRIARLEERLRQIRAQADAVEAELRDLREVTKTPSRPSTGGPSDNPARATATPSRGVSFTPEEKVALFRDLFRGRSDVFPRLWQSARTGKKGYSPACANEWVRGVCEKPRVKCGACTSRALLPVTDEVILDHLRGRHVVGVYPLLEDETCFFLAADFDGIEWRADVAAFLETCRDLEVPAAVERSRSGNGAHVWIFFADALPAVVARKLGSHLITETMGRRHELSLQSYDRLFPNQDTLPRGGFGNLIALPLQLEAREKGNTEFLDRGFEPHRDQWAFLASVERMSRVRVEDVVHDATREGRILGVRHAAEEGEEDDLEPWNRSPSRRQSPRPIIGSVPAQVHTVLAQRLFVETEGLPPSLIDAIRRLAAFQNPEFYKKQRMRLSTNRTPRVIGCAEILPAHVSLPRGCLPDLEDLLGDCGSRLVLEDRRVDGARLDLTFQGRLTPRQLDAARAMLGSDCGICVAPPGAGKTVLGAYLIAERKRSALVLVHRRPLLDQWVARLSAFLAIEPERIGRIGAGTRSPNGLLDVAMIQSLLAGGTVDDRVASYGHVVVDECHHVPAVSFERILTEVKAKYLLGLTATPRRRDGHHPILEMQLGPVRHEISSRTTGGATPFTHRLVVRETRFRMEPPESSDGDRPGIQEIYSALASDERRNLLIIDDVISAIEEGRSPLLLTERKDHLDYLASELRKAVRTVIVLRGGLTPKARERITEELAAIPPTDERLIVATGRYIGEGFDDARLDTLFLAMPVAWKGTMVQYVGRLQRIHEGKTEVRIVDYVDRQVPVLERMFSKRLRVYRSLGFTEVAAVDRDGGGGVD